MKKTVLVIAAVAAIGLAVPTAHATKVANPNELRVHHRAAVVPIGKCVADPDHIGGSTCEIATYAAADGVHVFLDNYNDYPVKISTIYADAATPSQQTTITTRVPAHDRRQFILPWGTANALYVQWVDEFNSHNLGSKVFDRP